MTRPVLLVAALLLTADVASAQLWKRARDAARRGVEQALDRQVEARSDAAAQAAVDALFDGAATAVRCLFTDDVCIRAAADAGRDVVLTDADGAPVDRGGTPVSADTAEDAVVRAGSASGTGGAVDANYDFEPGDRVLFADDFSGDRVGDFPRRLTFRSGSMEVVEVGGRRALRAKTTGAFDVALPETAPETFTLEFGYHNVEFVNGPRVYFVDADGDPVAPNFVQVDSYNGVGVGAFGPGAVSALQEDRRIDAQMLPVRVMADGAYVKVFVGEERVANVPNADLGRTDRLRFDLYDVRDHPVYVADVRVAAGGRDLYGALETEGRVVAGGITFDTASATLRPEAFGAVQEVAAMLRAHPGLRVRVEGHTDAQGDAGANLALSRRRAEAVRAMLVGLGVVADRVEAEGYGHGRPIASNDTAEGRAQNRRVELVRL